MLSLALVFLLLLPSQGKPYTPPKSLKCPLTVADPVARVNAAVAELLPAGQKKPGAQGAAVGAAAPPSV